jgi:hypothetical protein
LNAEELARRINARRITTGWLARCPAHSDRLPSLSISPGRDGRTLLKCHAGCEPTAIVSALGLSLRDLFADSTPQPYRTSRSVSTDDVELELQAELKRIVAADSELCGFDVAELTRHRNEARALIDRRFDVHLKSESVPWWEIDPHALDPAWRTCVAQAVRVTAARAGFRVSTWRAAIADLPEAQDCALRLAREYQRELAQTTSPIVAAA